LAEHVEFEPGHEVLVRRRWLKPATVEWVLGADQTLMEYGIVQGTHIYDTRTRARCKARRLIDLMVRLELHERWELVEHVNPYRGGYVWAVEYAGKGGR
jgi:hypothetical protein